MKRLLFVLAVLLSLSGCRTIKEQVPVYIHDTTRVVNTLLDSVYVDRWHEVVVKGDTVRIHDSTIITRDRYCHDTVYRYKEKPVKITEIREVAQPLTWWQKTQKNGFWALLGVIAVYIAFRWLKRRLMLKKRGLPKDSPSALVG